jgi:hypothetical protein
MRGTITLLLLSGVFATADTITLRNGQVLQGVYLGGTARQIRLDMNGNIQTFDIGQVQSVTFVDSGYAQPSAPPPPPPDNFGREREGDRDRDRGSGFSAPAPPPPGALGVTIPADSSVTVRMIEAVNSETARRGQTFRASLDEPIFVNGQQVVGRGADVLTKLVDEQQSGKIEGRTSLTLALVSIRINGQDVPVTSGDVRTESSSRGARSTGVIGGGAALGAIVGALAGGGKGAAIGATSGAAIGGGAEVLTKGQTVKIPSETRLTFRLQTPVQL